MKKTNLFLLVIILSIFVSCSSQQEQTVEVLSDTTSTTEVPASTTTTSVPETTTTTEVVYDGCIPEDNSNIDFDEFQNVQNSNFEI